MEEEESGIKWGAVFAVIKKRLIFIIAIAVVAALVAGLLTGFVFNAGKDTYTLSFDLKSPSGEGSLPDGTAFSVQNLVYSGNLQRVKDSNEMFAGLDIGILSSGDITITDNRAVEGEEERPAADARYTITAKESCFDSYEQADEFMHAVAESFVTLTQEALNGRNYSAWEQSYTLAPDYDERINVLRSQYNYVLSVYDGLIATRAYADFEVDGYTVEQHRAQAAGDISTRLTALGNEQNISAYVLGDSNNAVLYEAKELERQKQVNTAKIEALKEEIANLLGIYGDRISASQLDTFESFHADIASLTQRNVEIDDQLERLYTSIGYVYVVQEGEWVTGTGQLSKAPQTFTDEMEALRTRIAADTQTMSKVVSAVYSGFTAAEFRQAGAEVTSGGTNTIFVTVAVFVVAAFAAACVFALAGYRKQVSAEEAAQSEVKAADGGAEAQTADETEAAEQTDGSAESGEEKGEDK